MIGIILLLLALVCFILVAVNVPSPINLTGLGWVFVVLSWLVGSLPLH